MVRSTLIIIAPLITALLIGCNTNSSSPKENLYNISINTVGKGTVSKSPDKKNYNHNEEVKLKANANDGYVFIKWKGGISGNNNPKTIHVIENTSVKATFKTYKDAIDFNLRSTEIENHKVQKANLSITNNIPHPVDVEKLFIEDAENHKVVRLNSGSLLTGEYKSKYYPIEEYSQVLPLKKEDFKKLTAVIKLKDRGQKIILKAKATIQ
ncbi:MAG TPA: hypothetical protein VE912_04160 [Bacteroidales bacterium]|nr:hypothetical protein [Bacteroidales bacterium]